MDPESLLPRKLGRFTFSRILVMIRFPRIKRLLAGLILSLPLFAAGPTVEELFKDQAISFPPTTLLIPIPAATPLTAPRARMAARPAHKLVSAMPIIPESTTASLPMLIGEPDKSVDYKLVIKTPEVVSSSDVSPSRPLPRARTFRP